MNNDRWLRLGSTDANRRRFLPIQVLKPAAVIVAFVAVLASLLQESTWAGKPKPVVRPAVPQFEPFIPPPPRFVPAPVHPQVHPNVPSGRQSGPSGGGGSRGTLRHAPQGSGSTGSGSGFNRAFGSFKMMPKKLSAIENEKFAQRHHWHPREWHRAWGWYPWLPGYVAGTVTNVEKGDTITVLDNAGQPRRMRLFGSAAPEVAQPFGLESQQHLASLVQGKVVQVRTVGTDSVKEIPVAMIFYNGNYLSLEQISQGLAWNFVDDGYAEDLAAAEADASAEQRGIWSLDYPWMASVD
jgi:endonuclease YncB( thermonuclease family)